mmetsp:Transcript_77246/g.239997  ORF Transcript_77246/g.239997 Transcript_77246/m.239997 type:complete len:224 (-) Transcript_77246:205-876(-)
MLAPPHSPAIRSDRLRCPTLNLLYTALPCYHAENQVQLPHQHLAFSTVEAATSVIGMHKAFSRSAFSRQTEGTHRLRLGAASGDGDRPRSRNATACGVTGAGTRCSNCKQTFCSGSSWRVPHDGRTGSERPSGGAKRPHAMEEGAMPQDRSRRTPPSPAKAPATAKAECLASSPLTFTSRRRFVSESLGSWDRAVPKLWWRLPSAASTSACKANDFPNALILQ